MKALPRLIPSKLRYRFDNWLAWSPFARFLFVLIFGAFALGLGVTLLQLLAPDSEPAQDVLESLWWAWGRVADPGTGSQDTGRGMRTASVVTTFAGLCVFVLLIGFVAGYVQDKINELRQTGAPVGEEGHTLILGFGDKTLNLIDEISIANAKSRRSCVVILSARPKDDVIGAILDRFGANKVRRTQIVVREGSSSSPNDLLNVAVLQAASVIVLSDDGPAERGDVRVVKTLLAMLRGLPVRVPGRIVVELEDPQRLDVVKAIDDHGSVLVVSRDFLGRLMVQTARQAGLAAVYGSLLSFEGDEFYLMPLPDELVGKTFHDAWTRVHSGVVAGVLPAGESRTILSPSEDHPLAAGDRLLVLLEDDAHGLRVDEPVHRDRKAKKAARKKAAPAEPSSVAPVVAASAQRVVILGFKQDIGTIVAELDQFLGAGSSITIVSELAPDDCLRRVRSSLPLDASGAVHALTNVEISAKEGDTTARTAVEDACAGGFDAAIVLADDLQTRSVDESDARTLMSLLLLQSSARTSQPNAGALRANAPRTVSEIRNPATKDLILAARVGDFVVSDELVSQLLAQVSRTPELGAVWSDLCSAQGFELYIKPLGTYATTLGEISFTDLQARVRARGELALGWSFEGRLELNPKDKHTPRPWDEQTRAIVLAEREQ